MTEMSGVVAEQDAMRSRRCSSLQCTGSGTGFRPGLWLLQISFGTLCFKVCLQLSQYFCLLLNVLSKVLFSLSQPDLHFFCLRLKTWASPDPCASVSSLLKPQNGTFMISQVPSRPSNFISCNHKISDKLTKNLRM